jgi:hypothetical protein
LLVDDASGAFSEVTVPEHPASPPTKNATNNTKANFLEKLIM